MSDEAWWVIQLALGAVFLLSATGKLRSPIAFARGVVDYEILPPRLAFIFGFLVIPLESFLAFSHLTGWLLVAAVPIGLAILLSFAMAVGLNLARGRGLPCYCFGGQSREMLSGRSLARLVMMISGEFVLLVRPGFFSGSLSRYTAVVTERDLILGPTWMLFVMMSAMWALSLPDLIDLLRRQSRKMCPDSVNTSVGRAS